jgi:hypothetical protein
MSTNFYFNNFPADQITSEQLLVEDLVIEAMQIYGMDVFYLPRGNSSEMDMLYGENQLSTFTKAHPIEMYMENVTGMDGEGDFISKFGLEIRDEVTMLMSRRRFKFATQTSGLARPNEGDLIYIPLVQNFFEISFVEHENNQAMFHTLGRGRGGNVYVYALKLKQFVFSDELILTGITQIDEQIRDHYKKTQITLRAGGVRTFVDDETIYIGSTLATANAQAIVHTYHAANNKLDVYRVQGTFANTNIVKGVTSNAQWTISGTPDDTAFDNDVFEDINDNTRIQSEGSNIMDWTETNPFGEA